MVQSEKGGGDEEAEEEAGGRKSLTFSPRGGGEDTDYKGSGECLQQRLARARAAVGGLEGVGVHVKRCGVGEGG